MVGIDHVQQLVEFSEENIRKNHGSLIDSGNIKLVGTFTHSPIQHALQTVLFYQLCFQHMSLFSVGDGREGYAADGPFDAIHVGAAAPTLPQAVKKSFGEMTPVNCTTT